jgi:hypothetical protein
MEMYVLIICILKHVLCENMLHFFYQKFHKKQLYTSVDLHSGVA